MWRQEVLFLISFLAALGDAFVIPKVGENTHDPEAPQPPAVDLSAMELAPAGSDVIEEQYRKREKPKAPDTDHISLEE